MKIRAAIRDDIDALYEMAVLFNDSETAATPQTIGEYLKSDQEIVFIAENDEGPIGFVTGRVGHHMCFSTPIGDILEIFVKEEHRKSGVGAKLFERIEDEFARRGVNRLRVFTTLDNATATNFYKSHDYVQHETVMFRKDRRDL